jgi:exopolysaccharide biosynthesis predicted pyruvyltransferase EpsI
MNPKVIISLTSHPKRIHIVHFAITSIINQTIKPDHIILNLAKDEFPNGHNNCELNHIKSLDIHYTENYKVATKLLPTLKRYPNDIIITIDDDRLYSPYLLELLLEENKKHPYSIICPVAKKCDWNNTYNIDCYNQNNDITSFEGFAGVLYPPNSLADEVFDFDVFKNLCPFADDVWFQVMALKKKTNVRSIKSDIQEIKWPPEIPNSQEHGLFKKHLRANQVMYNRCLAYYGLKNFVNENCSSCKRNIESMILFDYDKKFCPVCLNQDKKKILCVGSYDYGNLGDESYKIILKHYLQDDFDVYFVTDTVRINKNKKYILLNSTDKDLEFDDLIIGGGGILYPWNNESSIKYYLDHCIKKNKPYYFISVGISWTKEYNLTNMIDYLKPIKHYIQKSTLCAVRNINDYNIISSISDHRGLSIIPDIGYLLGNIYYCLPKSKKYITLLQTGSANIELKYVRTLINKKLQEYDAQLVVINTGGSENPISIPDYAEWNLFSKVKDYYPDAQVYYGSTISTQLKDLMYTESSIRKADIFLQNLLYIINESYHVFTGRFHGIIFSKMLNIPYTSLTFNYKNISEESHPLDYIYCENKLLKLISTIRNDYKVKDYKEWSDNDRNYYIVKLREKSDEYDVKFIQAMTNEQVYWNLRN